MAMIASNVGSYSTSLWEVENEDRAFPAYPTLFRSEVAKSEREPLYGFNCEMTRGRSREKAKRRRREEENPRADFAFRRLGLNSRGRVRSPLRCAP
jgi:hypothetical protein